MDTQEKVKELEKRCISDVRLMLVMMRAVELLNIDFERACRIWYPLATRTKESVEERNKELAERKKRKKVPTLAELLMISEELKKKADAWSESKLLSCTDYDADTCDTLVENSNAVLRICMMWANAIHDNYDQMALERFMESMPKGDVLFTNEDICRFKPIMGYGSQEAKAS